MTLKTYTFTGIDKGPTFLAMGGIHGDETCGMKAIGKLVSAFENGDIVLQKGTVIAAPICNPDAYAVQKRFVEYNLNRIIQKWDNPKSPEHNYAVAVTDLIDQADIVLDLHSCTGDVAGPFLFLDKDTPEYRSYAKSMPVRYWVTGWEDVYQGRSDVSEGDTMSYTLQQGKKGLLVECGQHTDPMAPEIGYQSLIGALAHFDMLGGGQGIEAHPTPEIIQMIHLVTKEKEGRFSKVWKNFDPVEKGQVIANFADGTQYLSPMDGVIVLPKLGAKVNDEWFYLGTHSDPL